MLKDIKTRLSAMFSLTRRNSDLSKRSLDAASGGRRWTNAGTISSLNAEIMGGSSITTRRAAYYSRNNPWITSAINSLVSNMVGTGIKPRSQHPNSAIKEELHRAFDKWQKKASATADFYSLQRLAMREIVEKGECFVRMRTTADGDLRLDLLDAAQIPLDHSADSMNGRVRAGVEFDADGDRTAYHVYSSNPNDPASGNIQNFQLVRISADDVLHAFEPLTAGQVRGLSWLAPVLTRLRDLDAFEDAALTRAKVANMFAGFITDPTGNDAGLNPSDAATDTAVEPGALISLPVGADIRFSEPKLDIGYPAFTSQQLRAIAAGLGLPVELMSGDYSQINYSSARASLVEFRRRVEGFQHGVFIPRLLEPIWRRFITLSVLRNDIAADLTDEDLFAVEWLPPVFDWVDPAKDIAAEVEAINAGLKSRAQSLAERGYDVEKIDREIAADKAREKALGLSFAASSPAPVNAAPVAPHAPISEKVPTND